MIFAVLILIAVPVALLSGGSLENLRRVQFEHVWLLLIALIMQVANAIGITGGYYPIIYSISLVIILLFIILNIKLKGFKILGLGQLGNTLVITLNGGYMPVKEEYVPLFASAEDMERINAGLPPASNFVPITSETHLPFLADIILVPHWIISIGDILILIGGLFFIFYYSRFKRYS